MLDLNVENKLSSSRYDILKEAAHAVYGHRCECGEEQNVKFRFVSKNHPEKADLYRKPLKFYRKLLTDPALRRDVRLLCSACRYRLHLTALSS